MAEANVRMNRRKSSDSAGSGSSNGHVRSVFSKIKAASERNLSLNEQKCTRCGSKLINPGWDERLNGREVRYLALPFDVADGSVVVGEPIECPSPAAAILPTDVRYREGNRTPWVRRGVDGIGPSPTSGQPGAAI